MTVDCDTCRAVEPGCPCSATYTISLVAQDGRGDLLRLQRHQGAWRSQLAQGITVAKRLSGA